MVKISDLYKVSKQVDVKQPKHRNLNYNVEQLQTLRLDLRGEKVENAIELLDKFLDKAILYEQQIIDVLHGKGTGALQKAVHKYLNKSKYVKSYKFAPLNQGGNGITIVELL